VYEIDDMTDDKGKTGVADIEYGEALARLLHTDPGGLAASVAARVARQQAEAHRRITAARKEIEDGARSQKGRFRL
jgi:hypothetical protein